MDLLIEPITPGSCLLIEIINIAKANARPEPIFDHPHTSLDFSFRLRFVWLADTRSNSQTGCKVRKDGIPDWRFAIHLQKHAFHAIRERSLRQAIKIFKGGHHTANHGGGITALHEGDKAHARIAQDRDKAIELVIFAILLVMEFPPIVLHLLTWFGFIPLDRILSHFCWT